MEKVAGRSYESPDDGGKSFQCRTPLACGRKVRKITKSGIQAVMSKMFSTGVLTDHPAVPDHKHALTVLPSALQSAQERRAPGGKEPDPGKARKTRILHLPTQAASERED